MSRRSRSVVSFGAAIAIAGTMQMAAAAANGPATTANDAAKPTDWVHVDEENWKVLEREPQAHFDAARTAFNKGDRTRAAAELRASENLLKLQEDVLNRSEKDIGRLAQSVENSKMPYRDFDTQLTQLTDRITAHRWLPVASGQTDVVMGEPTYHLAKARDEILLKDATASVADLRIAETYLKIDADHATGTVASGLNLAAQHVDNLANDVQARRVTTADRFDQVTKEVKTALGATS